MQQPAAPPSAVSAGSPLESNESSTEAPPKQVALALERLSEAGRLIADIRLGADQLLEALFVASQPHHSVRPLHLIVQEEASMRKHLQDLRNLGRQLEESGVLTESLRARSNSWGLHMPLVCPDGAVVAYAWKRQLAGQAGASAVDRTRLALKAFTDQKRRFFPHLGDDPSLGYARKKQAPSSHQKGPTDLNTVQDILSHLQKGLPDVKTSTYNRLDWLKRATSLTQSPDEISVELLKDHAFQSTHRLRQEAAETVPADEISVIELLFPSIFRAVISLHSAGSAEPDAAAFFSPDEGGSYLHARGHSVHHVFRLITGHASMALQYFVGADAETALLFLLVWICSYRNLLSKSCSKCGRLLLMDKQSALLLPPVLRPYHNFSADEFLSKICRIEFQSSDPIEAFHIGCLPEMA